MANEEQQEDQLDAIESQDGSAIVEIDSKLLESDDSEEQNGFERAKEADSTEESDDDSADDNDELVNAKRGRRRAKKELIRKTNQEKDVRLMQLQRENSEFKQRLNQLERNTKTEGLMRIDKNIEDVQTKMEYAKLKIAEATQNQDGQGMVEAQTMMQEASEEIRQLSNIRHQADQELKRPQQRQQSQEVNPSVQRHAQAWTKRNAWYNPNGNDTDSRVAKKMDELLAAEGFDPTQGDYWKELDSRLQESLPHRYNGANDDDSRNVRRPRNIVGSSGREASAAYGGSNRSTFVLSPERVKAMKEASAWDNPERKARMIKQFIAFDRTNRS
jgi:hypothetical protein